MYNFMYDISDAITSVVGSRYEDTIIIGGGQSATGADGLDTFSLKGDGSSSITISDIETGEVLVLNDLSASAGNWEEIGAGSAVKFVEGQTETNLSSITFEKVLNFFCKKQWWKKKRAKNISFLIF